MTSCGMKVTMDVLKEVLQGPDGGWRCSGGAERRQGGCVVGS